MIALNSIAPPFDCRALLRSDVTDLSWSELHGEKTLVLLFDSIEDSLDSCRGLLALDEAADRIDALDANVALVSRDDEFEVRAWEQRPRADGGGAGFRFPIVLDADGRIAAMYEMQADDGAPLWGHCIVDAFGLVRQTSAASAPLGVNVEELIRCLRAILAPAGPYPC